MRSLEELEQKKKELKDKLREIKKEIAQHPETIKKLFVEREDLSPLLGELLFLETCSGWTDSRKNAMEWTGYRYAFKDKPEEVYITRYGSNWCHDFKDFGVEGEKGPHGFPVSPKDLDPTPYSLWESNEEDDDKSFEQILAMPRQKAVAYALWFTEGW